MILRFKYKKLCIFDLSTNISKDAQFEGANKIYPNSSFHGSLGYGSYIGPNCEVAAQVGRFTSIAPYVRTNAGAHPFEEPYATCCPMFYSLRRQNGHTFADHSVFVESKGLPVVGNDCWIGENAFLVGGITINDGAVVLAGAVVTKDVPPYAIVAGVPAKIVKYRYDEDTIKFLLNMKWWDKDIEWLKNNWALLCDITKLKNNEENSVII